MDGSSAKFGFRRQSRPRAPTLLRFLALHLAIGVSVAVMVVAGLILTDAHSLGRLIWQDRDPVVAVVVLLFGFVITFGSVAMGAAIMGLPYGEGGGAKGRRVSSRAAGEPIPAQAAAGRRR